jgi:hypothetical protein
MSPETQTLIAPGIEGKIDQKMRFRSDEISLCRQEAAADASSVPSLHSAAREGQRRSHDDDVLEEEVSGYAEN